MRITYEWTAREWDQAVSVAARKATRGTPLSGLIYAFIGIPLLGAVGDLISVVRSSGRITLAGSIVPMLLLLFAITAGLLIGAAQIRRRSQRESMAPMPTGTREMVLQEAGWRFTERPAQPVSEAAESAEAVALDPVLGPALTLESLSAEDAAAVPPQPDAASAPRAALRPWSDLMEARQGSGVIVLVHREGFEAIPTKALTPEQAGHLHRLVTRKMRPAV